MTKQQLRKIEKMQNQAIGLLNTLQSKNAIGDYEAQVYTMSILFDLNPETAEKDLSEFINQFTKMV